MADIVSASKRSEMMSGIRGKDTKPELLLRKELHKLGFRYKLHVKDLPGKPDLVFSKYNAVIFVHGCFWHSHNCHLFKLPSSRRDFWEAKLQRNVEVDARSISKLQEQGWRIAIVWECATKGKKRRPLGEIVELCRHWLFSKKNYLEIKATP